MEAQVSLTVAFSSSAFFGLLFLISSWQYPIDSLWASGLVSLLASQAHQHHGHLTNFWCFWQCGQVPSPAGKWNQHLHKACQQKEAWSALKFPGRWLRWLWTSENKVDQHQQMTWQPKSSLTVETSHWTSSNMDSVPLHSSSRLWDHDFQMKCKIYFHLKEDFGPLSNSPVIFSTAQVRCFWRCLWFRSGLVALFLKTSERGDSWCTDSSFSPLLVKLSQVFESALLDSILKLALIPVACAPFPTQILPSSQLCI